MTAAPRRPGQRKTSTPRAPMTDISDGNPFSARGQSVLFTAFDEIGSGTGYTDHRGRRPGPAHEIRVPRRTAVWPDSTPASSARAAMAGR